MKLVASKALRKSRVQFAAFAVAAFAALGAKSANANFLEDFYNSAGASVNITAPQAYSNQAGSVINGGSLIFRAPTKNIVPAWITPPSLKAGCGGIDIFLGAFGIVSKEQFIAFMKNIGQNAAGLAFKVALHALSPDLESKITDLMNTLQEYTSDFTNSCQTAQNLLRNTGAEKWIHDTVWTAAHGARAAGGSGDMASSYELYKNRGGPAINDAGKKVTGSGKTVMAPELNITWSALNESNHNMPLQEAQLIMSLLGGTIMRKDGTGDDASIVGVPLPAKIDTISQLVGVEDGLTPDLVTYTCPGIANECLNPGTDTQPKLLFGAIVKQRISKVRDNMINRIPSSPEDIRAITTTTTFPIYRIIASTTVPGVASGMSQAFLSTYSQAIAYEIAANYIENTASELKKMLASQATGTAKAVKVPYIIEILERTDKIQEAARDHRRELYTKIAQHGAQIAQIEQLERTMAGSIPAAIASNIHFK